MDGERHSTGDARLDNLLDGGYERDIVTTVYGPPGSGKTNLCLLTLVLCVKSGKKAIFIDSEGGFSITRFGQIFPAFKQHLDQVLLLKPMNFEQQKKVFDKLKRILQAKDTPIGLIIVDSMSMLYRLEMGKEEVVHTNRELGSQLATLTEIARTKHVPVLVTSQVYSSFDERDRVNLVGGDILKYGSKCLIELEKYASGVRSAVIRKHRSLPEGRCVLFRIVEQGLEAVEEKEENKDMEKKQKNESILQQSQTGAE